MMVTVTVLYTLLRLIRVKSVKTLQESPTSCTDGECECQGKTDFKLFAEQFTVDESRGLGLSPLESDWFAEQYMPQRLVNPIVDSVDAKRAWKTETYPVTRYWFGKIVEFSGMQPTVDAFASPGNNRLHRYWSKEEDAFLQDWSH